MKKIPTVFERDWNGDRSRVLDQVHPGCEWVLAGEGRATVKFDGTCCLVRDGKLYKRRELSEYHITPLGFEMVERDHETGKTVGWVPVGDGPEDKWHREAFGTNRSGDHDRGCQHDGTYELIGPKVQGNPEGYDEHQLIRHGSVPMDGAPRTFDGLRDWFVGTDIEGIVWHHPDGRMAKIKARDFGLRRRKKP